MDKANAWIRRLLARGLPALGLAVGAALGTAAPAEAQELTLGTKLELSTLDPHFFASFPAGSSHELLYEKLTFQDANGTIQPQLALGWKLLGDLQWEFKLRPNVKFHDGTPFTAADVAFTLERIPTVPNSPNSFAQYTRNIEKVEVVNPLTVRIHTKVPNPTLPLEMSTLFMVSAKNGKGAATADYNSGKKAIGTGPYKLAEWVSGERLVVQRFEGHWAGKPAWAKVTERVIVKDSSRLAALLSGQVDAIDLVPIPDLPRVKSDPRFSLFSGPAALVHYIAMDSARDVSPFVKARDGSALAKNPLKDARVRKALSLALNRDLIASRLMEGSAVPTGQILPSTFPGTSKTLKPDAFDPARAKALLAEAGWPDGFKLTLHATVDRYPNDTAIAQAIASAWTRIGLVVDVETMPGAVFFGRAAKQEFSAFAAQYGSDDAGSGLRTLLGTADPEKGSGSANRTRYSHPGLDRQLAMAMAVMDDGQRASQLAQVTEAFMADEGLIPVFHPKFDYAARKGLVVTHRPQRRFNALMIRPGK